MIKNRDTLLYFNKNALASFYPVQINFNFLPNRHTDIVTYKVKTIFHHLTKEELIEKVLANYLDQTGTFLPKEANPNTKNH